MSTLGTAKSEGSKSSVSGSLSTSLPLSERESSELSEEPLYSKIKYKMKRDKEKWEHFDLLGLDFLLVFDIKANPLLGGLWTGGPLALPRLK